MLKDYQIMPLLSAANIQEHNMSLYDEIIVKFPELAEMPDEFGFGGSISLRNDSDDAGDYIERWDYSQPLPKGMKIGK